MATTAHSDVDLLVDTDPDRSFLDTVGLGQNLEALLTSGRCVKGHDFENSGVEWHTTAELLTMPGIQSG